MNSHFRTGRRVGEALTSLGGTVRAVLSHGCGTALWDLDRVRLQAEVEDFSRRHATPGPEGR